ncbi:hypothetical protein BVY03_02245 [bacterium K02(2017)]|nr:hypothetical protein BVY03_02245 [bacterium K02(2017)]
MANGNTANTDNPVQRVNTAANTAVQWTAQAAVRLENIPSFVRETAKKGIENFALENGYTQVNEKCLDEAKEHFNM